MSTGYKYLPVIDQDMCNGCVMCVEACDHGCLKMSWAFATLARPFDCDSEGHCTAACPEEAIRMEWVALAECGERGQWRLDPPRSASPERERTVLASLRSLFVR
jgi:NAD-dependent dihydropyrimidine dehydrogenase PreA subunit